LIINNLCQGGASKQLRRGAVATETARWKKVVQDAGVDLAE